MKTTKWRGLRNNTTSERFVPGDLEAATNLDIDDSGKPLVRPGRASLAAGAHHSLWSEGSTILVAQGSSLYRVDPVSYAKTLLTNSLMTSDPIYYAGLGDGDRVFYANGVVSGLLWHGAPIEWGVRPPTAPIVVPAAAGDLVPGRYLVSTTYLRTDPGHESGSSDPIAVDLVSKGGIQVLGLPTSTNPGVGGTMIYLSGPDSETLYRAEFVLTGTFSVLLATPATGAVLRTQFASGAPAGIRYLAAYNGRIYAAQGNTVWVTDLHELELFRLADNFLMFPGEVKMLAAVQDGIYVSYGDRTAFLRGGDLKSFQHELVAEYAAIPGTVADVDNRVVLKGENPGFGKVWASARGVCVGYAGGNMINLTERNYSFPDAPRGAGIVRYADGATHYLSVLQGAGAPTNVQ